MSHQILLVEDDAGLARVLRLLLEDAGDKVEVAASLAEAKASIASQAHDLVVTDLKLPDGDGLEVLKLSRELRPDVPVLMMTAFATVQTAVQAMKLGAFDYITKPFENDRMKALAANALRMRDLAFENQRLRRRMEEQYGLGAIIGSSAAMERVREQVRLAAPSTAAVMVVGETGTGKELVARAIHTLSPRSGGPFVAVNCGAIPENLVESELFGHKKGAFTGAMSDRDGRFVQADSGSIFLDEVTETKKDLQVKLLRVLEAREVQPVGGTETRHVDVRIISATNQDPRECVARGAFREDLFYRLNVFLLRLPPLREHRTDIPELVAKYLERRGFPAEVAGAEVLALLSEHDFPGNVRELQNVIESGLILSQGRTLRAEHIADRLMSLSDVSDRSDASVIAPLDTVERDHLEAALKKTGGNQSQAARLLGISRATLIYRMKKHGLA